MQSFASGLPSDVAKQVHPDWRKNEADYWAARDALLAQHDGQWVAFAEGKVVASGDSPVDVLHRGQQSAKHPYFACVGREEEPCRMRREVFAYDGSYPGEPLPVVSVELRTQANQSGVVFDRVIPDTGADASAVPWADCQRLQLDPSEGIPGIMGGVGQSSAATIAFAVWARLDGVEYPCRLQADFTGDERILGRDVLNKIDVLFQGPNREVVINP